MVVGGHLAQGERMEFLATVLAFDEALTLMDSAPPAQIRQGEGGLSVAAVHRAEKGEQRLVLVDRQKLAIALSPPLRRKVEAHDSDLGKKWRPHDMQSYAVRFQLASGSAALT